MVGEVNLASADGAVFPVAEWQMTVHPKYEGQAYYDVGVIYLQHSLQYNKKVQPICLPSSPEIDPDAYKNEFVRLLGKTSKLELLHMNNQHGT